MTKIQECLAEKDPIKRVWAAPVTIFVSQGTSEPKAIWVSNPGPQSYVLAEVRAFETLLGGSRGGGKSAGGIAWLAVGNPDLLPEHGPYQCNLSYLNHPKYVGLVLRRNRTDLNDWVEQAKELYMQLGGEPKGNPVEFHFKSGARIYTNHLDSDDAYSKYLGHGIIRLLIEELNLIPRAQIYLKMLGSVRSAWPELREGVLSTTNPGGPGGPWVKARFVKPLAKSGNTVPPNTLMRDPITKLTRIFIPAKLEENKYLKDNAVYRGALLSQDEVTKRQWLYGDWDVVQGQYFSTFRPMGPLVNEPPEAQHVVVPVPLMAWYDHVIGMDWGYRHNFAVYGICRNQEDGRLYVHREFVRNEMDSEVVGSEIAKRWLPDLELMDTPSIPMFLSHDAFGREDATKTRAERIAAGIELILGKGSVFLMGTTPEEDQYAHEEGHERMMRRYRDIGGKAVIVIHNSGRRDRVDGWQYMRSLLRFTPVITETDPNEDYARSLLVQQNGYNKYEEYMRAFREQKREILPGLRIFKDACPRLVEAFSNAVYKEGTEDILEDGHDHSNDELDALRYGLDGMRFLDKRAPFSHFLRERMEHMSALHPSIIGDPALRAQVGAFAQEEYNRGAGSPTSFVPRASMSKKAWRRVN